MTRDEIIERMNWLPSLAKETDSLIGKIERIVRAAEQAEREAIHDEWSTREQGDLEYGVKWMNEVAAENWHGSFRGMSGFSEWLTQRGEK
jgi:hypothetical protein